MMPQASSTSSAAREQAGVAVQHVQQQPLVGVGHAPANSVAEAEVQVGQPQLHAGVGHLGLEVQLDALGRLNLDHQPVGVSQVAACAPREQHVRRLAELDHDLRRAAGHGLAAAEVERHALPTPVVDVQLERRAKVAVWLSGGTPGSSR